MLSLTLQQQRTEKTLFNDILILVAEHCTDNNFCNMAQEAPDSIAQKKILFNGALIL